MAIKFAFGLIFNYLSIFREKWKENFPVRDLQAFSADPLLIYPTRYLYEEGYVSDTEDSPPVNISKDEL